MGLGSRFQSCGDKYTYFSAFRLVSPSCLLNHVFLPTEAFEVSFDVTEKVRLYLPFGGISTDDCLGNPLP